VIVKHINIITIILGSIMATTKMSAQINNSFYLKHDIYEYAINPAVTGRDYYPMISFSQKKYWLGTNDSPSITSIGGVLRMGVYNFYTPKMLLNKSTIASRSRMGAGVFLMREQDGPMSIMYSTINYAYFIPLNNASSELSFGLSMRLQHNSLNQSQLEPLDDMDPELIGLDNSELITDASFGSYYHTDQLFVGASVNELFRSAEPLTNKKLRNDRDYFIHGGYKFFLKRFELEPSVFMGMIDGEDKYYYGRLRLYYLTYNWFSVAYRSTKAINLSMGLRLNRFYLVYIYDVGVSKMIKYFDGSHEIMFGLNIGTFEMEGIRKLAK